MTYTKELEGATVLVVDDNPKNVQVLGTILMEENYNVAVAMGGKAALEQIEKVKPEIILLDIMMPDMDGFGVNRILKIDENYKSIPVIFLTAKSETDDIVKGFEEGAVDYVTKPFRAKELLARVYTHIQNLRLRISLENKNTELKEAFADVKTLTGMLPICSSCKKIKDDKGNWQQIELYIRDKIDVLFSHGLCPDCVQPYYDEIDGMKDKKRKAIN